jgi:ABC-type lipoprotein release transport system permease subunit
VRGGLRPSDDWLVGLLILDGGEELSGALDSFVSQGHFWHSSVKQADGSEMFPLILERSLFLYTVLLATVTGLLAAMAPAMRAEKLDPVAAIHG